MVLLLKNKNIVKSWTGRYMSWLIRSIVQTKLVHNPVGLDTVRSTALIEY